MRGSEESLDEYDVDDKEYDHANCNEYLRTDQLLSLVRRRLEKTGHWKGTFFSRGTSYLRGNGYRHVSWVRGPNQTHGTCQYPRHAETKNHSGHDKLPAATQIELEDSHVGSSTQNKEHQKHSRDGTVEARRGLESQASILRGVGGVLWGDQIY
jgi:hypothetical protein